MEGKQPSQTRLNSQSGSYIKHNLSQVLANSESIHSYDIHLREVGAKQPGSLATIAVSGGGTNSQLLSRLKPNTEYSVFIIPHSRQALSRPTSLKIFKTKEDGKIFY